MRWTVDRRKLGSKFCPLEHQEKIPQWRLLPNAIKRQITTPYCEGEFVVLLAVPSFDSSG